jgi:EAL domain-containing protein (putative c-di-GMP-specific phosphodiesterase class I)
MQGFLISPPVPEEQFMKMLIGGVGAAEYIKG